MKNTERTSTQQVAVPCGHCGRLLYLPPCRVRETPRRFCNMACREAWRTAYQRAERAAHYGDGTTTKRGRVLVLVPEHPYANQRGYVLRARIVVEQAIGRRLAPGEVVHHRDGCKTNDSVDNLIVCPDQSAHLRLYHGKGGRWARNHSDCVECGTTERKHASGGKCERCYGRERARRQAGERAARG